ncbi:MAG: hypothetical protein EOP06_07550 [Proteobacteria bacterium]|nr:MAG: hypothetical protein EOP06_07550 [Pseudomonadota bacterium]
MKALTSLLILFSTSISHAETKVISLDNRLFGSRIEVVLRNAAALLGNAAIAQCSNGVLGLRNVMFQVVDGSSRVFKSEGIPTRIETAAEVTVIATALADCK